MANGVLKVVKRNFFMFHAMGELIPPTGLVKDSTPEEWHMPPQQFKACITDKYKLVGVYWVHTRKVPLEETPAPPQPLIDFKTSPPGPQGPQPIPLTIGMEKLLRGLVEHGPLSLKNVTNNFDIVALDQCISKGLLDISKPTGHYQINDLGRDALKAFHADCPDCLGPTGPRGPGPHPTGEPSEATKRKRFLDGLKGMQNDFPQGDHSHSGPKGPAGPGEFFTPTSEYFLGANTPTTPPTNPRPRHRGFFDHLMSWFEEHE